MTKQLMAALRELAEDLENIVQAVSTRDGDATARQHQRAEAVRAAITELAECDDRVRAEREATWRHAAKVVDYETGRDLDILEDSFNEDIARPVGDR
jgi:esterase/lipase superfamily enzyme